MARIFAFLLMIVLLFVHPVANDHSVEYKVTSDRKVVFLGASE